MNRVKTIINIIIIFLPWCIRRRLLNKFYGYEIHPKAKIGFSYVYPQKLIMMAGSKIGHFTLAIHLDRVVLGKNTIIGRSNWITGLSTNSKTRHFLHDVNRKSELIIGNESAITKHHHIDCTNAIHIGNFVTIAGYYSQLLTHSIDVYENRQDSHAIVIGDYCFVSTGVKILGGSVLPDYSILGAGAVLNKRYSESYKLYVGIPARPMKDISYDAKYFNRENGFVY